MQHQMEVKSKMDELNKSIEDLNTFKDSLNNIDNNSSLVIKEKFEILTSKAEKLESDMVNVREAYENMAEFTKQSVNVTLDAVNNVSNIEKSSFNIIERIQDFLSTLNFEQTLAFIHLSGSLIIGLSVLSMITIFYSEKLILYFKIEEKYPRFSKYIKLRSKFQHFYFLLDIIFIFFVLIGIVYINILILIHQ